ncbi:MAG: peptidoglycan peptidase [Akkermansiaceae bacterium]|nr:peptidoglycan peptidase [Akkermansiaceae bacterium]
MKNPRFTINKSALIVMLFVFTGVLMTAAFARYQKSRTHNPYALQNGDIVFQETGSQQAKAIKAATNSRWTHVGLVFFRDGQPMVIEAVQPVRITPLSNFIARNPESFYAMRLKTAHQHITPEAIRKAEHYCNQQLGKNYDSLFRWSDEKIYCSELVWKAYKEAAGIELCQPRAFRSYNLKHPTVQRIVNQRYGSMQKLPMDELCVAPSDLAQSGLLTEVPKLDSKKSR